MKKFLWFKMKPVSVQFKYNGDIEEIKANTLLVSLLGYVNLLEEVHSQLNIPKKLNIYISKTEKGSFIVDLNLALDTIDKIKSLLGDSISLDNVKDIIEIAIGLIILKVFLKGEKPKEVKEEDGKVIIINGSNNQLEIDKTVYKLAKEDELIDEAIIKIAEPVADDENIEGFEVKSEIGKSVKVSNEDLGYLKIPNPIFEERTRIITKENVYLTVVKVVFAENRKWEFLYEGNKISAHIKDDKFFTSIDNYSFKKGTKLLCDLEILQVYDTKLDEFVNKEFTVVKVHKVIPPSENKKLF